jgi:streptomycin 6-kinase
MTDAVDAAPYDLTDARALAREAAAHWGLTLEAPFAMSIVSYVAPAGDAVIKVPWTGDDESLHEPDALRAWNGNGAIRIRDQFRAAILEDRAVPGTDVSTLPDREATAIAIDIAQRLWMRAGAPFRPVVPEVRRWLDHAEAAGSTTVGLARELLAEIGEPENWLVHGDFHHHNIVRNGAEYVAIDPKPYLCEREYDVPSFLWNPKDNRLEDRAQTEERIGAFVAAGLDEWRIRAWTVIRGAYLRPELAAGIEQLLHG